MRTYETFLDNDDMHGETVIGSLNNLHFMKMPGDPYPDPSLKWMVEESAKYWEEAYKEVTKARNGI